jgi:Uma2 family endonuclease
MSQVVLRRRTSARSGNSRGHRAVVLPAKSPAANSAASAQQAAHRVIVDDLSIGIPCWVVDHASFRRWFHSDEFPEEGRVSFLNGEVIFDMSREQIFSHVLMKTEIGRVLANLAKRKQNGLYFSDGLLISNLGAEVSNNPDGVFVANASFEDGTVRLVEAVKEGFIELEGSPNMVLEVVSDNSEAKDNEWLRAAYWKAGIREYWLVDARGERLEFQILKHTRRGYSPVRKVGGWLKSTVFRKAFRLTAGKNHLGHLEYELKVR